MYVCMYMSCKIQPILKVLFHIIPYISQRLSQLSWETDHIIFTHRHNLNRESMLVIVRIRVGVMRYQLLRIFVPVILYKHQVT